MAINGSNFYANGISKWNQKAIISNNNSNNIIVKNSTNSTNSTNSIESIECSDITMDSVTMNMNIIKNNKIINFDINDIVSTNITGNIMQIFSGDKNPFFIIFKDNTNLLSLNIRLCALMNNLNDPGC